MPLVDGKAELLPPRTVAALLGVSSDTVCRWALAGRLPVVTLPSGHRRFRRSTIERLLATGTGRTDEGDRADQ
jgi:excisionase family DNA binding protein